MVQRVELPEDVAKLIGAQENEHLHRKAQCSVIDKDILRRIAYTMAIALGRPHK